jgi:hypothetical protein
MDAFNLMPGSRATAACAYAAAGLGAAISLAAMTVRGGSFRLANRWPSGISSPASI